MQEVIKLEDGVLSTLINPKEFFLGEKTILTVTDAVIESAEAEACDLDPTDKKGQKAIRSVVAKMRKSKTFIDKFGGEFKKIEMKPIENIDPNRRLAKHEIDKAIDKMLEPVIAEEQKETNKKNELDSLVAIFNDLAVKEFQGIALTTEELLSRQSQLEGLDVNKLIEESRYDISGSKLVLIGVKAECSLRINTYIDERTEYEAGQVKLALFEAKEADKKRVDSLMESLEAIDSLDILKAVIIDESYGERQKEAVLLQKVNISELEKVAVETAKQADGNKIKDEILRLEEITSQYLDVDIKPDELQAGIDGLTNKKITIEAYGEFLDMAEQAKVRCLDALNDHMALITKTDEVEEPEQEQPAPPVGSKNESLTDLVAALGEGWNMDHAELIYKAIESGAVRHITIGEK